MKIYMLSWDFWPGPEGGAERQCRGLSHELARLGHEVTVLCAATCKEAPAMDGGVEVRRLGEGPASSRPTSLLSRRIDRIPVESLREALIFWTELPAMLKFRRRFIHDVQSYFQREGPPDLVHVHETGWLAGLAADVAEPYHIPVLAKVRNTPALEIIGYNVPSRLRWMRKRPACYWVALHDDLKKELMEAGMPKDRISVIPNAVDMETITPVSSPERKTVLCLGNFTQGAGHKGFDVLLRAWGIVHSELPEATLILAGRGNSSPWQKMARQYGCKESVRFAGFVNNPETLFRQASLFVLASRREGMSNAFLEAQAHGVPAVVSDIPANRAVSPKGQSCLFFTPGDERDLAEKITLLLSEPDRLEQMGTAAHEMMRESFSRETVTQRILETYHSLIRIHNNAA